MPEFPINWKIPCARTLEKSNVPIFKLELNYEWAIICVLKKDSCGVEKLNSIVIYRKNTAGDFSVSGELTIKDYNLVYSERKFLQLIKTGSSFIEIASYTSQPIFINACSLHGFVNIHHSEKKATNSENGEIKEKTQVQSLKDLSKDFERLLDPESSCFADVTLKCGDVSIPAHKIILSARSPVFGAMFANPMKESRNNEVEIIDIDVSTIRTLLKYMYTGQSSGLTVSSAADLLFTADKYQLQDLKSVCSYLLKNNVSLQNVWMILVLGDMHSEDLKTFAVDYISKNCGEFSVLQNTQEWKDLRKENPILAVELLEFLLKYRDEKPK